MGREAFMVWEHQAILLMTDWITDRRPTEADGDKDMDVRVRYGPDSEDYSYLHWSHVGAGVPWKHCGDPHAWKPAAESPTPEPAEPVGFIPTLTLRPSGEIPQVITTGAAPFYVLVVGDDSSNGNGEPIVFETQLPVGSTLQAVLQQRQRVGSRYGTTYVAECRIIPELTEVPF